MKEIKVELADRSYPVLVGSGCLGRIEKYFPESVRRVAIVTQEQIGIEIPFSKDFKVFEIGKGETAK